jgi:serine protease Do
MRSRATVAVAGSIWLALHLGTVVEAETPPSAGTSRSLTALEQLSGSFEAIAERVAPSVVQIFVSGYAVGPGQPNVLAKQQGLGSGVVLDPDGYIVTNAHVVSGARRIQVLLAAPAKVAGAKRPVLEPRGGKIDAELVGVDSTTDLAVIKIPERGLGTLQLGDSDKLRQGQLVLAFGSPLGFGNTVTMGVVSAVSRQLHVDDPATFVQTDAPINPGNSGGPLVDSDGRVVGLNTMIMTQSGGSEGVGLAIPSNTVRYIFDQLRAHGRVQRGVIGVQVQTVTPVMAAALHLTQAWGVIVADMVPEGPAEKAGVKVGDVILSTDGKTVENVRQFGSNLYRHAIDATVTLELMRGNDKLSLKVPVIDRPDDPTRFTQMVDPNKNLVPQLDILGITVDEKLAAALHELRMPGGVLVAAAGPEAAPPGDRFLPGDVIHAVNGTEVSTLEELRAAVAGLKDGDPVVVQIEREDLLSFVAFEVD